jgi:hydrogenase maturation protein HypF
MHPQYLSTQIAKKVAEDYSAETVPVQHHHAHFAACLFENGVEETSAGILFDGTGYGEDGTIWGGEIFIGDRSRYERIGYFHPSRLPGGDAAVAEPWRYALGLLHDVFGKEEAAAMGERLWSAHAGKARMVLDILPFSPKTTSCGRFFDAAAALLGCGDVVTFDGQAAMSLEAMARGSLLAPFLVLRRGNGFTIDWRPVIRWILDSIPTTPAPDIAGGIHGGLARAVAEICSTLRKERGIRFAALSGGVWQNRRLVAMTSLFLRREGVEPLLHKLLPPNDECVSAGQTVVAAERFRREKQ